MIEPNLDATPAAMSTSQSFLWVFRVQLIVALLPLLLAELHTWSPELRAGLLGFTTGILLVLTASGFLPGLRITRERARRPPARPVVPISHRRVP